MNWPLIRAWTSYLAVNTLIIWGIIHNYHYHNYALTTFLCLCEGFMISLMFFSTKIVAWLNKKIMNVMIN